MAINFRGAQRPNTNDPVIPCNTGYCVMHNFLHYVLFVGTKKDCEKVIQKLGLRRLYIKENRFDPACIANNLEHILLYLSELDKTHVLPAHIKKAKNEIWDSIRKILAHEIY